MINAKFITSLRDDTVIAQQQIDSTIDIVEDLEYFWYANFTMPIIDGVEEDVIVELYNVQVTDILIFRGYIHQIKPIRQQFWLMEITLRAEKAMLYRRLVLSDTSYSSDDIKDVLEWLVSVYNSSYGENRTVDTDFTKNVSIDVKTGDNLYDILDELAEQCEAQRKIENWEILFKRQIGEDKSTGSNYQEVVYNWTSPSNANIASIDVVWTALRANVVVGVDSSWSKSVDNSQYSSVLYGVKYEVFRDWNLSDKITQKLDKVNRLQRSYSVDVEQNTIDAEIWDKIKLVVENTNSFFDFNGSVFVKKKNTTIDNWSFNTTYELEEFVTTPSDTVSFLRGIKKNIKLLQI